MKKILVIEDNPDVRENLVEILELSDYEVIQAEHGKIGVELAAREEPDLILCDVMMPELDGFGVLHILSKNSRTSGIPFIFLTAKSEKNDYRKGMNLGADDYITKPFDDVELLDAIEVRLKKSERIKKDFERTKEGVQAFIDEAKGLAELRKLSEDREIRTYKKKEFIYNEGDYPKRLYFIHKGKVKVFKTNDDGKEFIIDIRKEGDFLGYLALLKESRYNESASAIEDAELYVIPRDDFYELLHSNRDVSSKLIKVLADNVEEKENQLLGLAYNSVRKRVANALLMLHRRFEEEGRDDMSILRDDLASMVGTAKETVIRTLSDFRYEKLIDINGGVIRILDLDKLENLPN